jgi:hypothetical protein
MFSVEAWAPRLEIDANTSVGKSRMSVNPIFLVFVTFSPSNLGDIDKNFMEVYLTLSITSFAIQRFPKGEFLKFVHKNGYFIERIKR